MKYLLDTNTCIRYLNGRSPSIKTYLAAVQAEDIALCSVVKAELFYGALKVLARLKTCSTRNGLSVDLCLYHSMI